MKIKHILAGAIVTAGIAITATAENYPSRQYELTPEQKLTFATRIINSYYLEDVDLGPIVEKAITAMLEELDPHSQYTDPKETEDLTTPLDGNFSGIGIQFQMLNDTLYVIQTIAGGPSEKVGMRPGDRILTADGEKISGAKLSNSDITSKLRGPKGTNVDIKVMRASASDTIDFEITRDDIPVNSIDAAFMADPTTGYVKVSRFGATTADELTEALAKLKKLGMKQLILDLEDNGGGYLGSAVDIAGNFLSKGDLVTYTESPRTGFNTPFNLESNGRYRNLPLVVMVNQYSASASEILSGAIQDHDRGVIVGRRTFGKGLVQRPFPFSDGSMIRLTISRYHTPSGRIIQKHYDRGQSEEYRSDMLNRYKSGEFMSSDAIEFPDSLKFTTLKNHRTVYGGGGIMPDSFVPVDTTMFTDYYRDLVAKSIINTSVLNYVDANREQLHASYPDETKFLSAFEVPQSLIDSVVANGEKAGVTKNDQELERSLPMLNTILKAVIGRDMFDMSTYYKIVQPQLNPVYRRALEIATSPELYESLLKGD